MMKLIKELIPVLVFLLISCKLFGSGRIADSNKVCLSIYYKEAKLTDTLSLTVGNTLNALVNRKQDEPITATLNKNGYFRFEVPVNDAYGYFELRKPRTFTDVNNRKETFLLLKPQFWEKGDSITLQLSNIEKPAGVFSICTFSGNGSEKYNLRNKIDNLDYANFKKTVNVSADFLDAFQGNILTSTEFDSVSDFDKAKLNIVDKSKMAISKISYDVLRLDILYSFQSGKLYLAKAFYMDSLKNTDLQTRTKFIKRYNDSFNYIKEYHISDEALSNSIEYQAFLNAKTLHASYLYNREISLNWIYNAIKKIDNEKVRDHLIIWSLFKPIRNSDNADSLYADAQNVIHDPECLELLNEIRVQTIGRQFPDYSLGGVTGQIVKLSDFKNKVVFIDFWFTGCGHCGVYYNEVLSNMEKTFAGNENVVFVSISIDQDKKLWIKTLLKGGYTSAQAVNLYTNGLGAKHDIIKDNMIKGYPTAILLDKAGKIKYFNSSSLYEFDKLKKAIKNLL